MAYKRDRKTFEADLQKQESPYIFYGTPLPPLDEHTRDDGSYVPVWQQEVTDDRGRKRLHGAFTGGFSAGYYNTVGSKEGWTPSTFVSSRQNRMKDAKNAAQQRPEDFMDEEDLREAEESTHLSTTEGFAGFGTTEEDSRRRGGLMDVFRPTGETIGVKLLKKMGWKEGQGIGPRVRRKADLDDGREDLGESHLFAPENPPMIKFIHKQDFKGVGYDGEVGLQNGSSTRTTTSATGNTEIHEDDDESPLALHSKKTRPGKRSGFGVGILNDTGSDDDDAYEMGPKISYNKIIGSDKKAKKKDTSIGTSNPLLKTKPVFLSRKLLSNKGLSGFRKCHDGRLPLDGFVLSTELDSFGSISLEEQEDFKPLEVPPGWQSSKAPTVESQTPASYTSTRDAAKASTHTAQSRAAILGEAQLPSKSIFDFLTPAARDRLARASGNTNLPPAGSETAPSGPEAADDETTQSLRALVPQLDPLVATQALGRGWMPYAEDEPKGARYRAYLELRASDSNTSTTSLPTRAQGVSTEDWALELQEFARAAQVFKPVTGLMASRFTSSTSQPSGNSGGVEADPSLSTDQLLSKPAAKPEDPAEAAARMGMFGPLTRSVQNWYPTRLLCKRFNVKAPDIVGPDGGDAQTSSSSTGPSKFQSSGFQYTETSEPAVNSAQPSAAKEVKMLDAPPTTTPLQREEAAAVDPERNQALEQQRPGQAVFRAIFGSDDEDDD